MYPDHLAIVMHSFILLGVPATADKQPLLHICERIIREQITAMLIATPDNYFVRMYVVSDTEPI